MNKKKKKLTVRFCTSCRKSTLKCKPLLIDLTKLDTRNISIMLKEEQKTDQFTNLKMYGPCDSSRYHIIEKACNTKD